MNLQEQLKENLPQKLKKGGEFYITWMITGKQQVLYGTSHRKTSPYKQSISKNIKTDYNEI